MTVQNINLMHLDKALHVVIIYILKYKMTVYTITLCSVHVGCFARSNTGFN